MGDEGVEEPGNNDSPTRRDEAGDYISEEYLNSLLMPGALPEAVEEPVNNGSPTRARKRQREE